MKTKVFPRTVPAAVILLAINMHPVSSESATFKASSIIEHVKFLASDSMEGRRAGSRGARAAAEYIKKHFEKLGLVPAGDDGSFFQQFSFVSDVVPGDSNSLRVTCEGKSLEVKAGKEFTPWGSSATTTVRGELVFAGFGLRNDGKKYNDYEGTDCRGRIAIVLDDIPPHLEGVEEARGNLLARKRAMFAREAGAGGLLLVRNLEDGDTTQKMKYDGIPGDVGIPFAEITWKLAERLLDCGSVSLDSIIQLMGKKQGPCSFLLKDITVELTTEVITKRATGRNIVGMLKGNDPLVKDQCLVIGAHYDHIGMDTAEDGSPIIYNGADDNASGVAGLLELAAAHSNSRPKRSILFVAFDAEEIGALGSLHFMKKPPIPREELIAMVNMDMIGQMQDKTLIVSGFDTSPSWEEILNKANEGIDLEIRKSAGGFGGSDHTSFYKDDIPVLFFFTGAHDDYNTPRDDWDRIEAEGEAEILTFVERVVTEILNEDERPPFKRSEAKTSSRGRSSLSVYMGTVPDFTFEGEGFAIIGTKEGSPAEKAGLLKGDIITQMDGKQVRNIYDFMGVLSGHKPNDTISVIVTRGEEEVSLEVTLAPKE